MFLGKYELEGKEYFYIYIKKNGGWRAFHSDTFSPLTENIEILDMVVKGKNYKEKQDYLRDLAIDYQHNFAPLSWSYGELLDIQDFFYKNAKRYGLLKEFKENAIC